MTAASCVAIIWETALKQKILSHARAVFIGPVRPGTVFDVVTTTSDIMKDGQKHTAYFVRLIALDELSRSEKLRILVTTDGYSTEKDGMEALARNLQGRLSNMIVPRPPVPVPVPEPEPEREV